MTNREGEPTMDIDMLMPEPTGPTALDMLKAARILSDPEVAWAIDIMRQAERSGALDTPAVTPDECDHRWIRVPDGTPLTAGVGFRFCVSCDREEWDNGTVRP